MDEVPDQAFTIEDGLIIIRMDDSRSMRKVHTVALDAAIVELARTRPVGLLAFAPDHMRNVDVGVPSDWLGKSRDPTYRLRFIAVVGKRSAVRVAVFGFAQANRLLRLPLEVEIFPEEAAARAWLAERVNRPD